MKESKTLIGKKNSKLTTLLGNKADIISGVVLTRKKSPDDNGYRYTVFTLKSFNENGYIEEQYFDEFVSVSEIDKKQISKEGDVIIRLSQPYTAVYITKEFEDILIPSLFIIIRIKDKNILPQYIQIFLNSEKCKKQFGESAIGSAISIIKASTLKESIEIPVYPLEYQRKIIDVNNLILKEKQILDELIEEKNVYHKEIMRRMFK